jgi:hypothetical protein
VIILKIAKVMMVFGLVLSIGGCTSRTSLDVGSGQKIVVPAPKGFTPLGENVPKFRIFAERSMPPKLILVELYLTNSDFQDVLAGDSKFRVRSLSIKMPRTMFGREFDENMFLGAVYETKTAESAYYGQAETSQNELNEKNAQKFDIVPPLLSGGKWLGLFLDRHDAIGAASLTTINVGGVVTKRVSASVTMRVKNRFVMLNCTSVVNGDVDIQWAEGTCSKWAQDIMNLNF